MQRYFLGTFLFLLFVSSLLGCNCKICMINIPDNVRTPPLRSCTEFTCFEPRFDKCMGNSIVFEAVMKEHVRDNNNAAGCKIAFHDGTIKEVYRSSFLSESPAAVNELVKERGVRTVLCFHSGKFFDLRPWLEREKTLFMKAGAKNYIYVSDFDYHFETQAQKQAIFSKVRKIISLIHKSEGNVLIHCLGGEHRTGIVYGILHRCYHDLSLKAIIQEYKCHAAWQDESNPGGYREKNVELINDFPVESAKE